MIKSYIERLKNGLYIASDSFAMLWQHPLLLIYYLSLLITYALIFIFAYNIIGYQTIYLQFSNEFHTPQNNLLADLIPITGGLVYLGFIFSILLNILLRTFLSIALVQHTHALMHRHNPTLKEIYIATKNRWLSILNWSLLIGAITLLMSALSSLALSIHSTSLLIIITFSGLTWLILSFFVTPIIALTHKSLPQAIYVSKQLINVCLPEILGGLFWVGLVYLFTLLANVAIHRYLVPTGLKEVCMEHGFTIFNALFATILLIFKTRILHHKISLDHNLETTDLHYSQF